MVKYLTCILLYLTVGCENTSNELNRKQNKNSTEKISSSDSNAEASESTSEDKAQLKDGEQFFVDILKPALQDTTEPPCLNCHNDPEDISPPGILAPVEIWDYSYMLKLLETGKYSNDNYLFNKFTGIEIHAGSGSGSICQTETSPLCILLIDWWKKEFGTSGSSRLGEILNVTATGVVEGYAKNIEDETNKYLVRIYIDGDNQNGTFVGEQMATSSVKIRGEYRKFGFKIQVPANLIDNEEHEIHAYAVDNNQELELTGPINQYTAYAPKGQNAVNGFSNLGLPGSCGCHGGFPYRMLWNSLLIPLSPSKGGTAINNQLYLMSQSNSQRSKEHADGAQGNPTAIIQWWCSEFDPEGRTVECI